jgi:benzoate-CoA ligase family protein
MNDVGHSAADVSAGNRSGAVPRDYNYAADIIDRNLKAGRTGRPAYIDPRGTWTYGQLADRVARFAAVLRSLGVRREERVLIVLLDTIDWPTAFLGCLKAGAVAVPVNTLMTEEDYRYLLADSRARVLVVSESLYPRFQHLVGAAADLEHVVVSGDDAKGHKLLENLIAAATPDPQTAPTVCDDVAYWQYTSGSTGRPKGAVHVHADLKVNNDLYALPVIGLTENDVCYSVAKLFFAYGLGNSLNFPMSCGACTVLLPDRPTPEGVAALLRMHPITVFYSVPTFYATFLAHPGCPTRGELRLRCCISAGEALPADVGKRWCDRYGVDILDGLGSTEMTHIYMSNRLGSVKYGTSGKPLPGYDVKLVGEDGQVVKKGEMGEMLVRGPTGAIMYWNNRERSRSTFLGEWTRSGDKFVEDEEGYFVFCGRTDDMLKVSGMYVSPFEVEAALATHPDVLEAAVVAWADKEELIKPKAFVVLKDRATPAEGAAYDAKCRMLQDHVKERLAPYKYPRWIEFRVDLPKTATGKIQRFKLRSEAARG